MQDLGRALRRLMNGPGPAIASVATLAFSIGASAATWSLLSAVLLQPLPISDADRWFVVGTRGSSANGAGAVRHEFTYPVFPQIRDAGIFDLVIATWNPPETLLLSHDHTLARSLVGFATHNFFDALGVRTPVGRGFRPEDDRRGAAPVAILMDRYWRQEFNANPAVVGTTISLVGQPVTVVGVAAPGFRGLDLAAAPDLYLPLHTIADVAATSTNYFSDAAHVSSPTAGLRILGRLRDGDLVAPIVARLSATVGGPQSTDEPRIDLTPVSVAAIPTAARTGMVRFARLLAATVALLMLIGSVTVGLLLLIRTEARRVEFWTCLALGASVSRLTRSVALEAMLLTAAGAALAVPISWWLFKGLSTFQLPGNVNIGLLELAIDSRVILGCVGAGMASVIVITSMTGAFGFPKRMAGSVVSHGGGRVTRPRVRVVLVAAQVAVALVLLVGSTLLIRSLQAALSLNPGVSMDRIVTGSLALAPSGYTDARAAPFFDDLIERLRVNPAIESMAYSVEQGGMGPQGKLIVDGQPRGFPTLVSFTAVDPSYFSTMGIAVVLGRHFSDPDSAHAPHVAIVNASLAQLLGSGPAVLSHRVTLPGRSKGPPDVVTIVGVASDIVTNVNVLEPLVIYFPIAQRDAGTGRSITIRAAADATSARRELLGTIKQLDSGVAPGLFPTLRERIDRQMGPQRLGSAVLGALGGIALLLTILGTYVLSESMATTRRHELGIRAALGATGRQLCVLILAETTRLVGIGLVVGLGLVLIGSSTIRAFLFQMQPLDLPTLAGVAATILMLTLAVTLRPALRAARLDVARVLRDQ